MLSDMQWVAEFSAQAVAKVGHVIFMPYAVLRTHLVKSSMICCGDQLSNVAEDSKIAMKSAGQPVSRSRSDAKVENCSAYATEPHH